MVPVVRPPLAIIGSFIAVVATMAAFYVAVMLMWGHAIADEPFDFAFNRVPLALVVLGLTLLLMAFRLGSGKWPWNLRSSRS
jgi:hypothetical protein